jgi:hypothetical protein
MSLLIPINDLPASEMRQRAFIIAGDGNVVTLQLPQDTPDNLIDEFRVPCGSMPDTVSGFCG